MKEDDAKPRDSEDGVVKHGWLISLLPDADESSSNLKRSVKNGNSK